MSAAPVIGEITYDPDLPITAWREEIAATIAAHQVVVVAGETGSGKTTQLPKICLELGRRSIAHTQPRRIAARSVAERVAEELHTDLGDLVGYQVRFTRRASRDTRLKIMTDGVLLAEINHDRDLRRYDTIIIDEAHERSLNIDFLLGYLRRLIDRRPELKIIITSATIDTDRFSAHFAGVDGVGAPIIEVSGRTYPVEVRYRPMIEDGEVDQVASIGAAVVELAALGSGDILVFCSGEREIRDAADGLQGLINSERTLRFTEVLPLYARLSAAEQHRVFSGHTGRRIVLATNVAETSLTVPGIRYVVDTGTARISRYSARTKVQRLPIEPISRASADQRAGRCGRVAPGVCIRLYDEEDYLGRSEFTEPEILRTNLASVILKMTVAGLGDITAFPFVEAPDASQITDGLRLLDELGALAPDSERHRPRLTKIGRRLADVPVDPRLARMLIAADHHGCLRELLIIVSGLSIQDPRERPAEHRDRADQLHRRFWAPASTASTDGDDGPSSPDGAGDFVALLRLWDYLREARQRLSGNAFRRLCRDELLHFLRIREWQDLHTQLRDVAKDLGLQRNAAPAPPDRIHTAILTGLLSQVGLADLREEPPRGQRRRGRAAPREYLGARTTRFAINPGSSLARVQPPLIMAGEIVETTRLWARTVAPITAAQVEEVGAHLLKRSYSEPHWSARSGSVMAYETVSLYGVPIVAQRRVTYGRISPVEAREIFIRSALVEGQWRTRHPFFADNAAVRAQIEELEERTRRRDLVVDDQVVFDFYAARIPRDVTGGAEFDAWWKRARQETPDLLRLTTADLTTRAAVDTAAFPDHWDVGEHRFDVAYRFSPGDPRDGVTVTVPVGLLNQVDGRTFGWQVPGFRHELAAELIRTLPKDLRRRFVPAPDVARRALDWLADHPARESFPDALGRALRGLTGELVPASAWDPARVPAHLRVTVRVVGDDGTELATDRDVDALRSALAPQLEATLTAAAEELLAPSSTTWTFGTVPVEIERQQGGHVVRGYPALRDERTAVGLVVLDTVERAAATHRLGVRRLLLLGTPDPTRWTVGHLSNVDKLALGASPYADVATLLADARLAAVGELARRHGLEAVRDEMAFRAGCDVVRTDQADLMRQITAVAAQVLRAASAVRAGLDGVRGHPGIADDVAEQVGNLVFAGFLSATPYAHLVDLPRYLEAAEVRVADARRGQLHPEATATVLRCEDAYAELCDLAPAGALPSDVEAIGWQLEELRVSLFAQRLRTKAPVSEKRIQNAIRAARSRLETLPGGVGTRE